MKYTIHEVSNLLGVSSHTLRYYEKANIISPETNDENGYRYYSVIDTRRFNLARLYRGMGFSMEECENLLSQKTTNEIIDQVNIQTDKLREEILFKQLCVDEMNKYTQFLSIYHDLIDQVKVVEFEDHIRIEFSNNEIITKNKDILQSRETLLNYAPLARWVSRIPKTTLDKRVGEVVYHYGLNMRISVAKKLGIDISKYEIIKGGQYIVTIFEKNDDPTFGLETLTTIQDYIKDNDIKVYSDGFSSCIQSKSSNKRYKNYHYFAVQVFE